MMLADIKKCNVFAHLCRIDPSGSTNFYEGLKAGWPDGGGDGRGWRFTRSLLVHIHGLTLHGLKWFFGFELPPLYAPPTNTPGL